MALYRAMAYGPSQGEYTKSTLEGPLGKLMEGDIAVSPNLLKQFPMGSRVDIVDANGNVTHRNMRVADTSWITTGKPTHNSFEIWNGQDLGQAGLVKSGETVAGTGTTKVPDLNEKVNEMNLLIAMEKAKSLVGEDQTANKWQQFSNTLSKIINPDSANVS